ncbi:MAG TPA: hypothetical protein VJ521_08330, partial [Acidobacteriota bacterium]|nr:hypothetical protein [Acidobacteriota bacterium]
RKTSTQVGPSCPWLIRKRNFTPRIQRYAPHIRRLSPKPKKMEATMNMIVMHEEQLVAVARCCCGTPNESGTGLSVIS